MPNEPRWKQRYKNFEKAFQFFENSIEKPGYSQLEIAGLVQSFEFTFELAWKTIKDFLYEQGIQTDFPIEAIKAGFQYQVIEDGHLWLEMLEKRNELSHTYNAEVAENAVDVIKNRYYFGIKQVYEYIKLKIEN